MTNDTKSFACTYKFSKIYYADLTVGEMLVTYTKEERKKRRRITLLMKHIEFRLDLSLVKPLMPQYVKIEYSENIIQLLRSFTFKIRN